jgi:TM2 domain-containing membrane protein YozV
MNQPNTVTYNKKDIVLVLCLIGFVGLAGLHRFYTGHIFLGILYLITGGFFGIGTLIDLIIIISGDYLDVNGKKIS